MKGHLNTGPIIRRSTGLLMIVLFPGELLAQTHWQASGVPAQLQVFQLYTDLVDDALLVLGDGVEEVVCRLRDNVWDTIGNFDQATWSAARVGDSLVVGGSFHSVNGQALNSIACLVGDEWGPFGQMEGFIYRFRILNGELYAVGGFEYMDGHLCNGVAKRVGGEWVNVGNLEFESWGFVSDIALYQGQLVICGTISAPDHAGRDVMVYDGSSWSRLMETAVVGGFCSIRSLIEYQGDLVVTGPIDVNAGNAGHNIMRWDGDQWHAMDGGLTVAPGDFTYFSGGWDLAIHDSLLYVAGGFYYAGTVPARGIATWDGSSWCGLGGDLDVSVRSMTWYHDTLYTAPDQFADGMQVNSVAKYIGSYPDTCTQGFTAVLPSGPAPSMQAIVSKSAIHITLPEHASGGPIELLDASGRYIAHTSGNRADFPTKLLTTGLYVVRAAGYLPVRLWVP